MNPRLMYWTLMLVILSLFGMTACTTITTPPGPSLTTPTTAIATPTFALATPYAEQPAAGICASFDGQTVEIRIEPDAPTPRCAKILPNQALVVVNDTSSTIQVSIGRFSSSILAGEQYSINIPFGDYLAPGAHVITATPYFGAELWLESK